MSRPIKVGDRVAYAALFLRNTGQIAGKKPTLRGTVIEIHGTPQCRLCNVYWHGSGGHISTVLDTNLARVGTPAMSIN